MNAQMIVNELKAALEIYKRMYAEMMYFNVQYTYGNDEVAKLIPANDRHEGYLKKVLDDLYWKYAENDDTEDAYDEAAEQFDSIINDAKMEACKRAEMMRQANGIYLNG